MIELTDLQQRFREYVPDVDLRFGQPLRNHTSFRIGGNAEIMAFPKNADDLRELLITSAILDCKPVI